MNELELAFENYRKYFWTYEFLLPENVGFPLFGVEHMLWLIFAAGVTMLLLFVYRKATVHSKLLLERVIGWFMTGWILLLIIYLVAVNYFSIYELPLHLCSIIGILCGIHSVKVNDSNRRHGLSDVMGQTLYAIGLPSTVLALLFPNWMVYPALSFKSIEGFCFHIGIFIYIIIMLKERKIVPCVKDCPKVLAFLGVIILGVYFIDRTFQLNYIFLLQVSAGSPLELLWEMLGERYYLPVYLLIMGICVFAMIWAYEKARHLHDRIRAEKS